MFLLYSLNFSRLYDTIAEFKEEFNYNLVKISFLVSLRCG